MNPHDFSKALNIATRYFALSGLSDEWGYLGHSGGTFSTSSRRARPDR
jgi:hypothetical protein